MRAFSMWQPWASAVALGAKRIETRHWPTDYRGPIAIHAAKRRNLGELIYYSCCWNWKGALYELWHGKPDQQLLWESLPFGAIVAIARLIDCRPTESITNGELDKARRPSGVKVDLYDWTERQMGNFELGRFGWVLADIRALKEPIPFKGQQGFFSVPDDLLVSQL